MDSAAAVANVKARRGQLGAREMPRHKRMLQDIGIGNYDIGVGSTEVQSTDPVRVEAHRRDMRWRLAFMERGMDALTLTEPVDVLFPTCTDEPSQSLANAERAFVHRGWNPTALPSEEATGASARPASIAAVQVGGCSPRCIVGPACVDVVPIVHIDPYAEAEVQHLRSMGIESVDEEAAICQGLQLWKLDDSGSTVDEVGWEDDYALRVWPPKVIHHAKGAESVATACDVVIRHIDAAKAGDAVLAKVPSAYAAFVQRAGGVHAQVFRDLGIDARRAKRADLPFVRDRAEVLALLADAYGEDQYNRAASALAQLSVYIRKFE